MEGGQGIRGQDARLHLPLALYLLVQVLHRRVAPRETEADEGGLGHLQLSRLASGLHAAGRVHRIPHDSVLAPAHGGPCREGSSGVRAALGPRFIWCSTTQ